MCHVVDSHPTLYTVMNELKQHLSCLIHTINDFIVAILYTGTMNDVKSTRIMCFKNLLKGQFNVEICIICTVFCYTSSPENMLKYL